MSDKVQVQPVIKTDFFLNPVIPVSTLVSILKCTLMKVELVPATWGGVYKHTAKGLTRMDVSGDSCGYI